MADPMLNPKTWLALLSTVTAILPILKPLRLINKHLILMNFYYDGKFP